MFHRRAGLPDDWYDIALRSFGHWHELDDDERAQLGDDADWLLRHKSWEAAHGFALSDEMRTVVALEAALLILGLGTDHYREVGAVIMFPTTIASSGVRAGPVPGTVSDGVLPVLGEAHSRRGPVLIAWDEARRDAGRPGQGHNVVLHEFAHKLDMLDDLIDGTPPLPGRAELRRWVEVCTPIYTDMRAGADRPPLQPYGATSTGEFFAVATEAFFEAPAELQHHEHDLYDILRDFYHQDPARRAGSGSFSG
ncbi:MAG TPA: M90 family metallopeptidase [Acidimicrobiia bacterium]|nr:M90 family metallopeptidase [Acidimicrobiia bacterium]